MKIVRSGILGLLAGLAGCVHGYGCLFEQPVKHTLTGRVHFREYPTAEGVDHVPILALDHTVYVYAPAHSYSCMGATDMQLVGISEFPERVIENSPVSVTGSIFESTAAHEYTRFLIDVTTLLPRPETP